MWRTKSVWSYQHSRIILKSATTGTKKTYQRHEAVVELGVPVEQRTSGRWRRRPLARRSRISLRRLSWGDRRLETCLLQRIKIETFIEPSTSNSRWPIVAGTSLLLSDTLNKNKFQKPIITQLKLAMKIPSVVHCEGAEKMPHSTGIYQCSIRAPDLIVLLLDIIIHSSFLVLARH